MRKITAVVALGLALPFSSLAPALSASAAPSSSTAALRPCRPWMDDCSDPLPPPPPDPCPDTTIASANDPSGGGDWGDQHQHSTATLYHHRALQANGTCADTSAFVRLVTHTWTNLVFQGFHATATVGVGQPWAHAYRYGVDDTLSGFSDRLDIQTFGVPLTVTYPGGVTEQLG